MKNKKGFTLLEIIAVIVILALLSLLAGVSINAVSDRVKTKSFCTKIQTIEAGAMQYGDDKKSSLFTNSQPNVPGCRVSDKSKEACVSVNTLITEGYLKNDIGTNDIVDPRNKNSLMNKTIKLYAKYNRVYAEYQFDSTQDMNACK